MQWMANFLICTATKRRRGWRINVPLFCNITILKKSFEKFTFILEETSILARISPLLPFILPNFHNFTSKNSKTSFIAFSNNMLVQLSFLLSFNNPFLTYDKTSDRSLSKYLSVASIFVFIINFFFLKATRIGSFFLDAHFWCCREVARSERVNQTTFDPFSPIFPNK